MTKRVCVGESKRAGSALLVVLGMLGILAMLAMTVAHSVSGAAVELATARAVLLSEADLHAGIELGSAAILKLGDDMRSADASADLAGRHIAVHITNERARIDLNRAPPEVLTALLVAHGVDDGEAAALTASLHEWRGGSASQSLDTPGEIEGFHPHTSGLSTFSAPTAGFARRAPKAAPGTRYLLHPLQLVSVPGFSLSIVRSLLPFVTVANGSAQVDPFIASRGVLETLPGTTTSQVDAFIEARDGNTSRETAILLLGVEKKLLTDTASLAWRLEINSLPRSGGPRQREAVIVVTKDHNRPYRVLYVGDAHIQNATRD